MNRFIQTVILLHRHEAPLLIPSGRCTESRAGKWLDERAEDVSRRPATVPVNISDCNQVAAVLQGAGTACSDDILSIWGSKQAPGGIGLAVSGRSWHNLAGAKMPSGRRSTSDSNLKLCILICTTRITQHCTSNCQLSLNVCSIQRRRQSILLCSCDVKLLASHLRATKAFFPTCLPCPPSGMVQRHHSTSRRRTCKITDSPFCHSIEGRTVTTAVKDRTID